MYPLLGLLRKSKIVRDVAVLNFVDEEDIQVFHGKAVLIDDSLLFIRELATTVDSKYSYHWQRKSGKLICRWDNAPYHPSVKTFPHHKHEGKQENVLPTEEITLEVVLNAIERRIAMKR